MGHFRNWVLGACGEVSGKRRGSRSKRDAWGGMNRRMRQYRERKIYTM